MLERFGRLTTRGPRNRSGMSPDRLVLEDLLIALGWIGKRHVSDGLLAKYTMSGEAPNSLIEALKKRWRLASIAHRLTEQQFDLMCRLAVSEFFDPNTCRTCKGNMESFRWHKGKYKRITCPTCLGTGVSPFPMSFRSRSICIDVKTWKRRELDNLYHRMLVSLGAWESYGRRRMAKALRGERDHGK